LQLVYQLLSSSGYVSVSESVNLVRTVIKASFDELGESVADALLENVSHIYRLPIDMILLDFPLLEKSIRQVFGYSADLIIASIRNNLMEVVPDLSPSLSVGDMISQILESETTKFLKNLPSSEHIVLLHRAAKTKEKMISAFLDAQAARGVIFSGDDKYGPDIHSVSYKDILKKEDKAKSMSDLARWIAGVRAQNKITRIVGQADAWFLNNGFSDELISLEKGLGPRLEDDLSVFCTYDLRKITSIHLYDIITSHDYVLLDNPLVVYGRRGHN